MTRAAKARAERSALRANLAGEARSRMEGAGMVKARAMWAQNSTPMPTQMTMLTTWLVEIYLDSMGKLRDRGSFVDGFQEKIQTIREEFQRFLSLSKLRECLDLNKNTIYALISSHGALDDLVYFANLMQDYERL